jgi:hypothetical protein
MAGLRNSSFERLAYGRVWNGTSISSRTTSDLRYTRRADLSSHPTTASDPGPDLTTAGTAQEGGANSYDRVMLRWMRHVFRYARNFQTIHFAYWKLRCRHCISRWSLWANVERVSEDEIKGVRNVKSGIVAVLIMNKGQSSHPPTSSKQLADTAA